jgi:Skp family chaperone for outer membrane proteins
MTSAVVVVVLYAIINYFFLTTRIAYVNTGKLMVGFSEANKVEREIKAEDDKWQAQLKILQDSLQAQIDRMSKEYDRAPVAKKKELQDMLSARRRESKKAQMQDRRQIADGIKTASFNLKSIF